jgi:hypothetical protein
MGQDVARRAGCRYSSTDRSARAAVAGKGRCATCQRQTSRGAKVGRIQTFLGVALIPYRQPVGEGQCIFTIKDSLMQRWLSIASVAQIYNPGSDRLADLAGKERHQI